MRPGIFRRVILVAEKCCWVFAGRRSGVEIHPDRGSSLAKLSSRERPLPEPTPFQRTRFIPNVGLEPTHSKAPEPKSGVSTNSTSLAILLARVELAPAVNGKA